MGMIASQITNLTIVHSTVYSDAEITSKLRVTGLCAGNSPGTGELPAQMVSNAESVIMFSVFRVDRERLLADSGTTWNDFNPGMDNLEMCTAQSSILGMDESLYLTVYVGCKK